ncbi:hypothetical protein DFQ14_101679 [Halopolyspora algeriensis]|uniref:Uncharacterized protein n=1 Tax=Halopolyspora algeriensis TaxID=1500506 RepID=A0A368W0W3_9ACTN|nr:hypothetical protein [Halopolyspora algeriensis]RCW47329.1 hypothetical protein DFQ14_101679 [Halopolyspora algeriensis]TQM42564.1 hypothetical protein FHU43_4197 [Halopolyspora algeriensis]
MSDFAVGMLFLQQRHYSSGMNPFRVLGSIGRCDECRPKVGEGRKR